MTLKITFDKFHLLFFFQSFSAKNAFIATQYPLPETVGDFWSMVYHQKSKIVVILQEMDYTIEVILFLTTIYFVILVFMPNKKNYYLNLLCPTIHVHA